MISQVTQYKPVFDIFGVDNVTVGDGFTLVNGSGPPSGTGAVFRGEAGYAYSAGVWTNGNGISIGALRIKDFGMGVTLYPSSATVIDDGVMRNGNRVGDLEVSGCNHGVLYMGQSNLRIGKLYVHDHVDSSAGVNPMHAIYGNGPGVAGNKNISVADCFNENNSTGCAYQFKYVAGLSLGNMRARNTMGLINVIDSFDVTGGNLTSVDDVATGSSVSIQKVTTQPARMNLGTVTVIKTVDAANPTAMIICDDTYISNLIISVPRSNSAHASTPEVALRGNRITLDGVKLRNTGTSSCRAIWIGAVGYPSGDVTVRGMEIDGYLNLVDIDSTATGLNVIDYAPASQRRIGFMTSAYIAANSGTPAFRISRRECTNVYTQAAGATARVLAAMETVTMLEVTDNVAFVISGPTIGTYKGLVHDVAIRNASGGVMGAVTWSTYTLRGAFVAPANGDTILFKFMWDGATWREVRRS